MSPSLTRRLSAAAALSSAALLVLLSSSASAEAPSEASPLIGPITAEHAAAAGSSELESAQAPSMNELLAQGSGAQDAPAREVSVEPLSPSSQRLAPLGLTLGVLLLGCGLGAGAMAIRQRASASLSVKAPVAHLKLLKSVRLGPKHQISLVQAQRAELVLGVAGSQITLLARLDGERDLEHQEATAALSDEAPLGSTSVAFQEDDDISPKAPSSSSWETLFERAVSQRHEALGTRPQTEPSRRTPSPEDPPSLNVVTTSSVELRPDHLDPVSLETEEYTLTEACEEEIPSPSHDGMFAEHDARHHGATADEAPAEMKAPRRRTRRSRESDSMLIALAAMREEAER